MTICTILHCVSVVGVQYITMTKTNTGLRYFTVVGLNTENQPFTDRVLATSLRSAAEQVNCDVVEATDSQNRFVGFGKRALHVAEECTR